MLSTRDIMPNSHKNLEWSLTVCVSYEMYLKIVKWQIEKCKIFKIQVHFSVNKSEALVANLSWIHLVALMAAQLMSTMELSKSL